MRRPRSGTRRAWPARSSIAMTPPATVTTVAILQGFTPQLRRRLGLHARRHRPLFRPSAQRSRGGRADRARPPRTRTSSISRRRTVPDLAREAIGGYLADAELLGVRTAQMHLALASRDDDPAFTPEPFTPHYQRSIYQYMRTQIVQTLQVVRRRVKEHPEFAELLERESELHERVRGVLHGKIDGLRASASTATITSDRSSTPATTSSSSTSKASRPARSASAASNAAHYATSPACSARSITPPTPSSSAPPPARTCAPKTCRSSRPAPASGTAGSPPPSSAPTSPRAAPARTCRRTPTQVEVLLSAYLIEKALYEIVYELNNRPDWVRIPLRGVLDLLD